MNAGGPDDAALSAWLAEVHQELTASATECSAACWGPVNFRHRTVRPEWFAGFDDAWAVPDSNPQQTAEVDLVTAGFADLPPDLPPAPVRRGDLGPRGEVLALAEGPLRLVWDEAAGQVLAWDRDSGRAVLVTSEPPNGYELVSPVRFLVHWAIAAAGGTLIHAAAVGSRDGSDRPPRGVVLVGDAGYGKSTSTLACLQRGWVTAGDDAVAVFPDDVGWSACAIYRSVKTKLTAVEAETSPNDSPDSGSDAAITPDVVSWVIGGRKRAHRLTATDSGHLVPNMRIDGLVVLNPQADPHDPVTLLGPAAARTAAAPSTTLPMPFERQSALTRIGALCRELPAFMLPRRADLSTTVDDLAEIAAAAQPQVSVIVPVFNGQDFVADALRSIAGQDAGRFQVIVVDDASTDGSLDAVEAARADLTSRGHELLVLRHGTNAGVAAARNTGIRAATRPLVSFLDQDDLWPADRTARLYTALLRGGMALGARDQPAEGGVMAAFGRMDFHDVGTAPERPWRRTEWFERDHPGHVLGASLMHRAVFSRIGELDEKLRSGYDDVDWLMRLRDADVPFIGVAALAVRRRIHDDNQSKRSARGSDELLATVRTHVARLRASRASVELDVIIPVHNVVAYLPAAVESALRQRGADVRVIVVDDGSDEDVAALIESWAEPRVTLLRHPTNRGIGAARNTGTAICRRSWLGFLDADDLWPLERTRDLLIAQAEGAFLIGRQLVFNNGDDPDPADHFDVSDADVSGPLAGAMLFPRAVFDRLPAFDEHLRIGEFIDWCGEARSRGIPEQHVQCVSLLRRSHAENTTRTNTAEFHDYLTVVARARARGRGQQERADPISDRP